MQPLIDWRSEEGEMEFHTFREIRKKTGSFGSYQKRLFLMMGCYWITASFFLILPFYFFKSPTYCQNPQGQDSVCKQCGEECVKALCSNTIDFVRQYVKMENTLTYQFSLFCGRDAWRFVYKIGPQTLSLLGLLLFGYFGDEKGRKLAFKVSWRFYTIGLVFCTFTETQFLISFGYILACINCFPSLVIQFVLLFEQIGNNQLKKVYFKQVRQFWDDQDRSVRLIACYLLLSFLLIAPLIASFLADYLVQMGRGITFLILCTGPSVILSFLAGFLQESPLFLYRDSKLHAFNVINKISKINGTPPIIIDLSSSYWRKLNFYRPSIFDLLKHVQMRKKIYVGFLLAFVFFFNSRNAQIQLDSFTDTYLRGTIMNSTTAVATITIIFLLTRFQVNHYRYITFLTPFISFTALMIAFLEVQSQFAKIATSIALRYISDLSYSMFLIWAIQTYPTVSRARCLGIALTGSSLGCILAYSLYSFEQLKLILSICLGILVVWASKWVTLDYQHKLRDTLSNNFYDHEDKFKSF